MTNENVPILCEECRILALAYLEGIPLCPNCLMAAVRTSADPYVLGKITPLFISRTNLKGMIKSRRKKDVTLDRMEQGKLKQNSSY